MIFIKYIDKFWCFLVYILALFPILPRGIESVLMIILFLSSLVLFFGEDKKVARKEIVRVVVFASVFIIYVISLIYSDNVKEGFSFVVRVLPMLIFPVIFGVFRKGKLKSKHIQNIINIYIIALVLGLIYIHIYLGINFKATSSWEYRNAFEALTKVHGTYYSLWLAFGVLILFLKIVKAIKAKKIAFAFVFIFILSYFMYWQTVIGARLPLITTVLLLITTIFLKIRKQKIVFLSVLLFAILGSVFLKPNYFKKTLNFKAYKFTLPKGDYHIEHKNMTSEQIRMGIYHCSFGLIKDSWVYGYGIGDVESKLQNCYKQKIDSNVYQLFNYNSHNQYLHFLLSSGIIGLLVFLISIFLPIYLSVQSSNYLYLLFSLLLITSFLTENVLNRHDGVLLYSFFNAIFAFQNKKNIDVI